MLNVKRKNLQMFTVGMSPWGKGTKKLPDIVGQLSYIQNCK